jgi:phosphoglycolate phosphatase
MSGRPEKSEAQSICVPNKFDYLAADAYLFDIDGTLLNTKDLVHYRALNRAMRDVYGVELTIDGISYHGKTDLGILRAALERIGISGAEFENKLPTALALVRREVEQNAHDLQPNVCNAIPELLASLYQAGKLLGVASGNLEVVGWKKVQAAELGRFFSFGCFSDDCEMREAVFKKAVQQVRQRLGPEATICFVGDTPSDIQAARHVGAQVIAVATGVYKGEELLSHKPDTCVNSCSELLQQIERGT